MGLYICHAIKTKVDKQCIKDLDLSSVTGLLVSCYSKVFIVLFVSLLISDFRNSIK